MMRSVLIMVALLSLAGAEASAASPSGEELVKRCVSEDWQFGQSGGKRFWRIDLRNTCLTRFRCKVMANISTPGGSTQGTVSLALPVGKKGRPSLVSHPFPMKDGATHSAQGSKACGVI